MKYLKHVNYMIYFPTRRWVRLTKKVDCVYVSWFWKKSNESAIKACVVI